MPKINALFELDLRDETHFQIMQHNGLVTLFPQGDTSCSVTMRRDALLAILYRLQPSAKSFEVSVECPHETSTE